MAIPRAAVFSRMARREGSLQANGYRGGLGGVAAIVDHAGIYFVFWAAGQAAVVGPALSGILLCGGRAVDVFFERITKLHERGGRKPASDHQSIFSAAHSPDIGGALRTSGLRNWICGAGDFHFSVRVASHIGGTLAASFIAARGVDCIRSRVMDFGAERALQGRTLRNSLSTAILDARLTGGLSQFASARALAMALWIESDGRRHRRISLGDDRTWATPWHLVAGFGDWSSGIASGRTIFLPTHGRFYGRPCVVSSLKIHEFNLQQRHPK